VAPKTGHQAIRADSHRPTFQRLLDDLLEGVEVSRGRVMVIDAPRQGELDQRAATEVRPDRQELIAQLPGLSDRACNPWLYLR